jgi:predicted nucleic-acid-binding Zn-ribbon protein
MSELKANAPRTCPECGGSHLHQTTTASAGTHGPALLPGLGGFLSFAKFRVVVCADCALTRFYAEPDARAKLSGSSRWFRL